MKKSNTRFIVLSLFGALFFFNGNNVFSQAGKLTIKHHGIICHQQTNDDIFGNDGVGDEVYLYYRSGYTTAPNTKGIFFGGGSNKFGELNSFMNMGEKFSREKAGSVSPNGGLKSGDHHNVTASSDIIQNINIDNQTVIFIAPSIWEYDVSGNIPNPVFDFNNLIISATMAPTFLNQVRNELAALDANTLNSMSFILPGSKFGLDAQFVNIFKHTAGKLQSKPIGMNSSHEFNSKVVILNAAMIEQLANKDYGYGKGVFPVLFSDVALGNTANNGIYTVLFKINYTPAPAKVTSTQILMPTTMVTAVDTVKTPPTLTPVKNTTVVKSLNTIPASSKWVGTYTMSASIANNYYAFRLNADNSLSMLDANGLETGRGTYSISGNQFSAKYTYNGNRTVYTIAGTMDGDMISGTWEDESRANRGSWKVKKS